MIPARRVFEDLAREYDRWFDDHREIYEDQQRLLREVVPPHGRILEVGTGSGRFAVPLGIVDGLDPSRSLLAMAVARGMEAVQGEGEHLPYRAATFDGILLMTVICFLGDPAVVLREAFRVLAEGGTLVVGFIEPGAEDARPFRETEPGGRFLQYARFRTADEVAGLVSTAGFAVLPERIHHRKFCVIVGKKMPG